MISKEYLEKIKSQYTRICIFGMGKIGTVSGKIYIDIFKKLGFEIECYCDTDRRKWGTKALGGEICISPKELLKKRSIFVLVMVAADKQSQIVDILKENGLDYCTYSEMATSDFFVDFFLTQKYSHKGVAKKEHNLYGIYHVSNKGGKRVAVYTCICGNYDYIREPLLCEEQCDYYLITDTASSNDSRWKYIDIRKVVPNFIKNDNVRMNRFCKILGSEIFSEYDYSIYIDGNMLIKGELTHYLNKIGKCGLALFDLPYTGGDCLYLHGLQVAGSRAPEYEVWLQLNDYMNEGMPRHYGMFECNFIVRDNRNMICRKLMRDWWNEVYTRTFRDQLSFTYILWKNGFNINDIGHLGENVRCIGEIERIAHT